MTAQASMPPDGDPGDGIPDAGAAAQLACLLEVCAPKPGNVSPGRHFADTPFEAFLASAAAIGPAMSAAGTCPLGDTIRRAVDATRRWTRANTNLGIVLLLAPLAHAAHGCRWPLDRAGLRTRLRQVLEATTLHDAREVYAAIRMAAPGGLGRAEAEDVAGDPTLPLADVMRLAAGRDGVAHEYATAFAVTFEEAVPALDRARQDGLEWGPAVVETYLTVLAAHPDTHIVRRAGPALAREVSDQAAGALRQGGVRTEAGRRTIEAMDRALRDARNAANPGTTADLTAAAIYVALLTGAWRQP